MKVRTRLLGLLAVVTLMAGLLPLTAFATQQQEYPTKRCYEEVTEVKYQRPIYKTKFEYVKQVKGKVQKDIDPRGGHEIWVTVGAFDWEVWSGNSTQWSFDDVEILEQGSHNAIQAVWEEEINNITWKFRKRTTDYRYVKSGNTQQVQVDTETSDWLPEGQMPDGDGWVEIDRKTVKGDEIPCYKITASAECGIVYGSVLDNNTPYGAGVWGVVGTDLPALVPGTQTPEQVGAFSLPHEFDEDFNDGNPVTVTVFVVGPEGDYYKDGELRSSIFTAQVTVDTNCEDDRVTAVPPTVTVGEACEVNDSFTIPDTEGVVYFVNDEEAKAGTVFNTPGGYIVTAEAEDGYELTDPEWSMGITLEAGEPCPSTSTTTPSTTAPTTTPSTLPFTGADTGTMALAALVLTGLGGLILALSRKPEEDGIN